MMRYSLSSSHAFGICSSYIKPNFTPTSRRVADGIDGRRPTVTARRATARSGRRKLLAMHRGCPAVAFPGVSRRWRATGGDGARPRLDDEVEVVDLSQFAAHAPERAGEERDDAPGGVAVEVGAV